MPLWVVRSDHQRVHKLMLCKMWYIDVVCESFVEMPLPMGCIGNNRPYDCQCPSTRALHLLWQFQPGGTETKTGKFALFGALEFCHQGTTVYQSVEEELPE